MPDPVRITHVSLAGLKGVDRELDLGLLNLVGGPQGAGKSAVEQALAFAFLGYVPSLGKAEAATARLMREGRLEVEVRLDDGRSFRRALVREGQSLRSEAFASWLPAKAKVTEVSAAIRSLIGESDREAAEALDLRELLSASANERASRIQNILDASGLGPDQLTARGRALLVARLAGLEPERLPAKADALEAMVQALLSTLPAQVVAREVSEELTMRLRDGLAVALETARSRKLDAASSARDKVAARGELETRLAALGPVEVVTEVQARRDAAVTRRAAATRDLEEGARALRIRAEVGQALPGLEAAALDALRARREAEAALPRAAQARLEAEAIIDPEAPEAPAAVDPDPAAVARDVALLAEAEEYDRQARAVEVPLPLSAMSEQAAVDQATRALALAEQSPWRVVEQIADRLSFIAHADVAKEVDEHTLRLRELAAEHGGDRDALAGELDRARVELAAARQQEARRSAERQEATMRWSTLLGQAAGLRSEAAGVRAAAQTEAAAINAENRRVYLEAAGQHGQLVAANRIQRDRLLQEAAYLEASAQAAETALAKATADLQEVRARLDGIASVTVDVDQAQRTVDETTAEIAGLEGKLEVLRQAQARRSEMQALIAEIDRATAEAEAWKAAEWACLRLREEDLAARASGLEGRMRTFLQAAGRSEEPFLRAARGSLEFGWVRGDREISVEALSGGESCLFSAALAAAVIALRRGQVRLLLVEAVETDDAPALLRGLEAVAGELSNVLVASNRAIEASPMWARHQLAPAPAAAEVGA